MLFGAIPWFEIPVAVALNGIAALGALLKDKVTPAGAAAGFVIGMILFLFGGALSWLLLMTFFLSSILAGRAGGARKQELERLWEKGNRRDQWQALANAGPQALAALLAFAAGASPRGGGPALLAVAGGFAAATADTWASELGSVFGGRPVSLRSFRRTRPGESGAISAVGSLVGAAGGATVAFVAFFGLALVSGSGLQPVLLPVVTGAGLVGMLGDSLLGAFAQVQYRTPVGDLTERREEGARRERGLRFVNNDVVNLAATALATGATALVWMILA